ncbi:YbaB/EbfC family nucleoid-associated protein [Sphaerisporangium aureirubrum]|uniref:YbaB/EbfC family nucleoid-associated protein n=1 Tax=Sphaerisporangium aureirubrum TaxID=1544736 RepID=A0ABW1NH36_9ACTN
MRRFDADPANWREGDLERDAEHAARITAWIEEGQADLEEVVGEGDAADGQVTVTTTSGGRVRDVTVTPRAMRLDSRTLAEEIMAAVGRAQDDADRKCTRLVNEALGGILPAEEFEPGAIEERFTRVLKSFGAP